MATAENQPRAARERGERGDRGDRRPFRRGRQKVCVFCVDKVKHINYKDISRLRQMMTEHAKIKSRRVTGTCAKHQRQVAEAVKRARHMALLPFVSE
jgi:small subunit ribosomal protein S18